MFRWKIMGGSAFKTIEKQLKESGGPFPRSVHNRKLAMRGNAKKVDAYRKELARIEKRMLEIAETRPSSMDLLAAYRAHESELKKIQREVCRLEGREHAITINWPFEWSGSPHPQVHFECFRASVSYSPLRDLPGRIAQSEL